MSVDEGGSDRRAKEIKHGQRATPGRPIAREIHEWIKYTPKWDRLKIVQVWDCIVKNFLKEFVGTTYNNKIHILFDNKGSGKETY